MIKQTYRTQFIILPLLVAVIFALTAVPVVAQEAGPAGQAGQAPAQGQTQAPAQTQTPTQAPTQQQPPAQTAPEIPTIIEQPTRPTMEPRQPLRFGAEPEETVEPAEPEDGDQPEDREDAARAALQRRIARLSAIEQMVYNGMPAGSEPLTQFGYRFFDSPAMQTVDPAEQTEQVIPRESTTRDQPPQTGTAQTGTAQTGTAQTGTAQTPPQTPTRHVGPDYILGPGDVLQLFLWGTPVDGGDLSSIYQLRVQSGGTIFFAPTGPLAVMGRTVGEIQDLIRTQLERRYRQIGISLTVESLRTFPVYVAGYVDSPGTVGTTAVDTLFQVLARTGGIEKTGSLRSIMITRRTGERITVDLYELLLEGQDVDVPLQEGDSILVPPIGPVAGIYGQVRRPGIYELKGTQTVEQLLEMAGGALPSAFLADSSVTQFSQEERIRVDGSLTRFVFRSRRLDNGDILRVGRLRDEERNRLTADGAFKFPGNYSVERFGAMRQMLAEAQPLPEANLDYGRVYRTLPGGDWANFTFSPRRVMNGTDVIQLRAGDQIHLYSREYAPTNIDAERFPDTVALRGALRQPQLFAWYEGMTLRAILNEEMLRTETNRYYGRIYRTLSGGRREDLTFSPDRVIRGEDRILLHPRDEVRFYVQDWMPAVLDVDRFPDTVTVRGEIRQPQLFAWHEEMTLRDILSAEMFRTNTSRVYAEVLRTNAEGRQDIQIFSPDNVLRGEDNLRLEPRDVVTFSERYVFPPIRASGDAVEHGMVIPYYDGVTLIDLVSTLDLGYDIKDIRADITGADGQRRAIYLEDEFGEDRLNYVRLRPGDEVRLSRLAPEERRRSVLVRGQVTRAGSVALERDVPIRLSDALERTGGYTDRAFPRAMMILRESVAAAVEAQIERHMAVLESSIAQLEAGTNGTDPQTINIQLQAAAQRAQLANLRATYGSVLGRISLEIPDTLEALRGSSSDIVLEAGDQIIVPSEPDFVSVLGEVTNSITINYTEGMRVRDLLDQAGWAMQNADIPAAYIVKASGRIVSATNRPSFLFFNRTILNDRLEPGDLVYIPREPQRVPVAIPIIRDVTQIIGNLLSTSISAITLLVTVGAI